MKSKNIIAQAYSPLGSTDSPILKDEEVVKLAEKYGVGAGSVLIGYLCTSSPFLSSCLLI